MQRESVVTSAELSLLPSAGSSSVVVPPSAAVGPGAGRLRVAIVAESFLPTGNGVTNSVCRVLEHLARRGHEAVVICPGPAPESFAGFRVVGVPSFSYRQFPVGMPSSKVLRTLSGFRPDIVHLASPFVLGAVGVTAAGQLGVPTVAVFQTDVPAFAQRHHMGALASTAWRWVRRIHSQADLTLAPSSSALEELREHAVPRLALWQRGVDSERFHPDRRETPDVQALRARLAPNGEVLVGYVGRLATEKRVDRLVALAGLPNVRLVVAGDGPHRKVLERTLKNATFLGWQDGDGLADTFAALDLFVHTGTSETFGQTLQEAMASGVPVVAPAAGGPLDLVTPGTNGLLYRPEDDDDLRHCVQTLADDPEQRRWMGAAGRVGVQRNTWEMLGDELLGHYRSVLGAGVEVAS
ncbi:glycosyltransferase family 1 protein [Kineosporia rhizophila]|uniref:glycosyltransferase family 4 protein n=1 Tax=Kineosporia TaxID=49184 RepID=UPI001E5DB3DE|nr:MULTISPECIES: glycosyltransferase family 1 protein [Kineosporia]MCE0536778.1 glycosyltransferase family 1 protein [Kineosporia rhizophila]